METEVDVDGRVVRVTHPDRVLWPATGTVKVEVIDYYLQVAHVMLPHIRGRPVTLHRYPEGVTGPHFFQTRCPPHPEWVHTTTLSYERTGKTFEAAVLDDRPSLVWAANLSAIEIHPFLSCADSFTEPTWLVLDLDPGPPAGLVDAARVALCARDRLAAAGLKPVAKTSGAKGLHVYARLPGGVSYDDSKAMARTLAESLAQSLGDVIVTRMTRSLRPGRVFVDWSQNDAGKSTVAPYSLRGLQRPTVSTPLQWDELADAVSRSDPSMLAFTPTDTLRRIEEHGDLFAPVLGL